MPRFHRAGAILGAGLAATGMAVAASLPVQAATGTGWRLISRQHYGTSTDYSGLMGVVAPTATSAWAVGGTNLGVSGGGSPVARRWNGTAWQNSALPAGLKGRLYAASAPSASDVWAASGLGRYVLHWNGSKWLVAKQWPAQSLPQEITGITAFSASNVWVFGGSGADPGLGTWHLSGGSWHQVTGTGSNIDVASAVSSSDIWAVAGVAGSFNAVLHYNGTAWKQVTSPALAGLQFSHVLAPSAGSVWVTGSAGGTQKLIHYNGSTWQQVTVPSGVQLTAIAADGQGGLWFTAQKISNAAWLAEHRSGAGAWTAPAFPSGTAGLFALARIPGTTSMWAAGMHSAATGADTAVWGYGPAA